MNEFLINLLYYLNTLTKTLKNIASFYNASFLNVHQALPSTILQNCQFFGS